VFHPKTIIRKDVDFSKVFYEIKSAKYVTVAKMQLAYNVLQLQEVGGSVVK